MLLCRVTQDRRTVSDQQEVDSDGHDDEVNRRGARDVGRVPLQVRLAGTRDVEVAARLVAAREQSHVDEQGADVLGRAQRRATIVEGHVLVEERVAEVVEDDDTVGGERHAVDRRHRHVVLVRHNRMDRAAPGSLAGELTRRRDRRLGQARQVSVRRHHVGEAVPVAPLQGVRRGNVPLRAGANEHVLNGPLQLTQEQLRGAISAALPLLAVHADQREADALDVDVVHFRVHEDVVDVQLNRVDRRGSHTAKDVQRGVDLLALGGRTGQALGGGAQDRRRDHSRQDRAASTVVNDRFQVHRGELEQQVRGLAQVDRDKALAEGNRHERDRQTNIVVEPEAQLVPDFQDRLLGLRRLRAVNEVAADARHVELRLEVAPGGSRNG